MIAEGLFKEAEKQLRGKSNYDRVMCLNMYGRMIMRNPKREREAASMLKQSENLAEKLPYWYFRLSNLLLFDFDFSS